MRNHRSIPSRSKRFLLQSNRLALRCTQPPIQWVHVAPFPRVNQTGTEAIHSISYWQTHNHHWDTVSKDIYKPVKIWHAIFHWIAPEILRRILHHKHCLLVQSQIWTYIIHLLVAMHHLHPLSLFVHTNQLHMTKVPSETGIGKVGKVYSNIYPTRCNITQFILSGNCSTCFGWYHHPSSGAQTTVSIAPGICHTITSTCHYRGRVGTGLSVLWVM